MKNNITYRLALILAIFVFLASCQKDDFFEKKLNNKSDKSEIITTKSTFVSSSSSVTLIAGQNIDAGTITSILNDVLYVNYTSSNGFILKEAHLFVGTDLSLLPTTNSGNPKVGNFPYKAENINSTNYTFSVPISQLISGNDYCNKTVYIAAHASLSKIQSNGSIQNETGWGFGTRINSKGNWGTYFSITTGCENGPTASGKCETAFGYGNISLIDLNLTNSRWGWAINVKETGTFSAPIYAAAGRNIISNGYYVGDLIYTFDGKNVSVTYNMFDDYKLSETHLYLSNVLPSNIAPGQYGNSHENLNNATSDTYTLPMYSSNFYIIAHAVVCSDSFVIRIGG